MNNVNLNYLSELEAESIYILREVVAQFDNPVMLFSGGKDSTVMVHLAIMAFWPAPVPFPLLHIDTGHNFPEALEFRDKLVRENSIRLIIRKVEDSIKQGRVTEETGNNASRNKAQTVTLLDAIEELKFDCAIGGGRRDEEKARAKERIFSHRDKFGQWDPRNQRPEIWNLFNGRKNQGEHFRVFPISNWTEVDIWQYIYENNINLPSLYFSHKRIVFKRNGILLAKSPYLKLNKNEVYEKKVIRFRTVGDMTCTGAIESKSDNIAKIIEEVNNFKISERGTRADDFRSLTSMEDRKREGYF